MVSDKLKAIGMALDLMSAASEFITKAHEINMILQRVDTEGRDKLNELEWERINSLSTKAQENLKTAIEAKKARDKAKSVSG